MSIGSGEEEACGRVEQWAEIRRMHGVERLSIREISRRTGLHRKTVRRALASETPPRHARAPAASKLDPFRDWICEQLREDPRIQSLRLRRWPPSVAMRAANDLR